MNILYIDTGYEAGGGTKSFLYLLEFLDKTKYKPFVFFENNYLIRDEKLSNAVKKHGAKFFEFNKKPKISKLKKEFLRIFSKTLLQKKLFKIRLEYAKKVLNNILNEINIDLIHLNNHFSSNLEYIIAANELGIKVVQHLRKNSELAQWEIELLKNQKFHTISVSKSTYNFYNKFLQIDKNIIYNPFLIDINNYKINKHNKIKILFPANYLENKGHKLVFEALHGIKNIELYLAGTGKFDKDIEIGKNGLQVIELGFVDLDEWYKKVDYVISFSKNEGLPRVVIEGLLYGCGIISSDYNVIYEIYELSEKRNFYIIKRDVKQLNSLFKNLQPLEHKIPDEKIKKTFSLENYISQIENLYKSLL